MCYVYVITIKVEHIWLPWDKQRERVLKDSFPLECSWIYQGQMVGFRECKWFLALSNSFHLYSHGPLSSTYLRSERLPLFVVGNLGTWKWIQLREDDQIMILQWASKESSHLQSAIHVIPSNNWYKIYGKSRCMFFFNGCRDFCFTSKWATRNSGSGGSGGQLPRFGNLFIKSIPLVGRKTPSISTSMNSKPTLLRLIGVL